MEPTRLLPIVVLFSLVTVEYGGWALLEAGQAWVGSHGSGRLPAWRRPPPRRSAGR